MSSVKVAAVQVGKSGTASLNFHWRNLLDGILRLTRGNVESPGVDVIQVNADNSISFPGNVASGVLGAGQTWQDVTASRVSATTYTNTTGKPIMVFGYTSSAGSSSLTARVNGVIIAVAAAPAGAYSSLSFVVPPWATYSFTTTNSPGVTLWTELR